MKSLRALIDEYLEGHLDVWQSVPDRSIDQWLAEHADHLIDEISARLARELDNKQHRFVEEIHSELTGFQDRLFETWRAPLTRLDSLIAMCMEIGGEINAEYKSREELRISSRCGIIVRLHIRAIQIANEISCLLKGGYADGAMARWRSLHETAVIIAFLGEHDDELSSRFVAFQAITRFKNAKEYNEHHAALGFLPVDSEDLARFQKDRDAMLAKYGQEFARENGWAAGVLKQKRVTFKDLERFVDLNHLRPQYTFASKNIHSGVDSVGFKLALSMSSQETLLAGPSNEGLIEPIQCASYSLILSTCALIDTAPSDERSIMIGVLWNWHERLKVELIDAEADLRQRAGDSQEHDQTR